MGKPNRVKLLWRLALLLGLLAIIAAVGALFGRIGLGEIALILAPVALVIVVEGGRFIVRQFLKGLRGPGGSRR